MAKNITDGKIKVLRDLQSTFLETTGKWAYSTDLGALEEPQSRVARLFSGEFRATKHGEKALTLASSFGPKLLMWLPILAPKSLDHVASQFRQMCKNIVVDRKRSCQEKGLPEKEDHDLLDTLIASGDLSHEHIVDETVHFLAAACLQLWSAGYFTALRIYGSPKQLAFRSAETFRRRENTQ